MRGDRRSFLLTEFGNFRFIVATIWEIKRFGFERYTLIFLAGVSALCLPTGEEGIFCQSVCAFAERGRNSKTSCLKGTKQTSGQSIH